MAFAAPLLADSFLRSSLIAREVKPNSTSFTSECIRINESSFLKQCNYNHTSVLSLEFCKPFAMHVAEHERPTPSFNGQRNWIIGSTMGMSAATASVTQALTSFGFGMRPEDAIPTDAIAWLTDQLSGPDLTPTNGLPTMASGLTQLQHLWQNGAGTTPAGVAILQQMWATFNAEVQFDLQQAITTQTPFRERLVWFWANHFAIMAGSIPVGCVAGSFLRDAIRPYVTGTVSQMLRAVTLHPAMIFSLSAQLSVGPLSYIGLGSAKSGKPTGINENLGRELLELYTVGIGAGYTQDDVDALAYLLTGVDVNLNPIAPLGMFYNVKKAQPGNFTLLGTTYPGTASGLDAALNALGTSYATYQHLATKLVTHFTSDTPAVADIQTVADALQQSGGDLPTAYTALVGLSNAWIPFQKIKSPFEYVVSILRAINTTASTMPRNINRAISAMGQPTWQPPFPNGWSIYGSDWVNAESMLLRTDWASSSAATFPNSAESDAFASIASLCSDLTQNILSQQTSTQERLTLLLCSPEFQRR